MGLPRPKERTLRPNPTRLRLLTEQSALPPVPADVLVDSYRRLADVFHDVLAEESLDALLERIAQTLGELIPHDSLTIYQAEEAQDVLVPVLAHDKWAAHIMQTRVAFDEGITGWAARHREPVLVNDALRDPRVKVVPGTPPDEPEALISVPLVARGRIKGVLNVYRQGEDVAFTEEEFELAKRFGDAAALALDNAEARERLEHQARTDSLTGLYNHRTFHDRLRKALHTATQDHRPVAVLMLDIDDFKLVNDIHGHGTGDDLLCVMADALRASVRSTDLVCRLGGEEFAVIMTDARNGSPMRLAARLAARMQSLDFAPVGHVTVSIGVACGPEDAMNPRELVACAEAAMMTAKARGKNQVVRFGEGDPERPEISDSLRARDVRSIAHLKMLQSLGAKLNRLNDVREIGAAIATELRALIDYHNCRVSLVEGDEVVPVAFHGDLVAEAGAALELLRTRLGEGITGRAAATGESLLIGDAANCDYARQLPGTPRIEESLLAVPLRYGARVNGVIVISKLGLDQFDDDDMRLLEVLAGHAAVAIENATLYQSARREAESATALLEFGRELASAEGLGQILQRIVELTPPIVGASRASIWMESDDGTLVPRAFCGGYSAADIELARQRRFAPTAAEWLRARHEPFIVSESEYPQIGGPPRQADLVFAVAPVALESGRAGCIVATVRGGDFDERQLRLLGGLAHQARLALANAGNFEGLERTFLSTVEALANALEANDEYTSSHARWITDLSLRVGRELGLDGPALKRLELGALFHDIGKIGIPGGILSKPGRLTAEERAIVEQHPELGERIIAPIDRLQDVRPIVRHCHERWDGHGYPDGKRGEEIPIEARIIFVCDAYHAMTTDRPYRKRLSSTEACRRLEEAAGSQFDGGVVAVALRVIREQLEADAEAAVA